MTARTRRRDSAATGASSGDDDLNDLRVALGYDKMSLMGFSYGTHLALATIRRHEPHIDNVVLAGVENLDETHKLPLNMDVQFRKLSRIVADDPVIGADVPDLVSLYKRVIEKLNREPMEVELRGGDNPRPVAVGAWGLNFILRFDIGDASDLPVFPRLLYSIDRGDPSVLTWFVRRRAPIFSGVNLMPTLTDGASGASPERWAMIRAQAQHSMFGDVMVMPWPQGRYRRRRRGSRRRVSRAARERRPSAAVVRVTRLEHAALSSGAPQMGTAKRHPHQRRERGTRTGATATSHPAGHRRVLAG